MIKLAVIGRDVSGSASPPIHAFIAGEMGKKISYGRVSVAEEKFEEEIESLLENYDGLNVTIPYKISIIPKLKSVNGDARIFGAVNTVNCADLSGHNTDGLGFMRLISSNGIEVSGKKALVLGAGGAGRSVAKKLADAGAEVEVYNRTPQKAQALALEFGGIKAIERVTAVPRYLIVNATGVGMHESVGLSPVPSEVLARCEAAVDLIYDPIQSEFLKIAQSLGKKAVNGRSMLFYQAYYADCIFFGIKADEEQATAFYNKYCEGA